MPEWSILSLKEYLEKQIAALESRREAIREEDLRARVLTDTRMNDKFEEHNRFREQINHERQTYVTRTELAALKDNNDQFRLRVESALAAREGQSKGLADGWGYVVGALGAIGAVVAIVVALLK